MGFGVAEKVYDSSSDARVALNEVAGLLVEKADVEKIIGRLRSAEGHVSEIVKVLSKPFRKEGDNG